MWTESGFESHPLLTAVGRCFGCIKGWLSWTSVSSAETHLSFLVLTPQLGWDGKEATEGAALSETSASSSPALLKEALCAQVQALTRQTRGGGREGGRAL